jgi:putative DNA primase/helicase
MPMPAPSRHAALTASMLLVANGPVTRIVLVSPFDIKTRSKRIPPVAVRNKDHGDGWQDYNDMTIRAIIEGPAGPGLPGYGTKVAKTDLKDVVNMAARANAYHPIRDMVDGWRKKGWDCEDRISTFLQRILGTEQSAYTAMTFRMMMIANIARVETPGCKFDYALILQGLTGIGKSTLIKILYGEEYFGELDADLSSRQKTAEQTAGKWALELPELGSLSKSDYNEAKIFMRRQHDDVRMVYAQNVASLPRQCVIWGTTNEDQYLKDPNGNRSYWIIKCDTDSIDFKAILQEREQLWAQAVYEHDQMRAKYPLGDLPLTLTGEALETAKEEQEAVRQRQPYENWATLVMDRAERPTHKGILLNGMGLGDENPIGSPDDDELVLPACVTFDMVEDWLGFKRPAMIKLDGIEYGKMKNYMVTRMGCSMGPKSERFRVGGYKGPLIRGIIFPWATLEDVKRGYCLPVEAEPSRNDEADN